MKRSLTVVMVVSCLVMVTPCFAQTRPQPLSPSNTPKSTGSAEKQSITYVELIQLDAKTQIFNAKLVNVNTGRVLLTASGKGSELQDFQNKSATLAPRAQTATLTGPWAQAMDLRYPPPPPPHPPGGDLRHLANQVARSYEAILEQQLKLQVQPVQRRLGGIDPRIQPAAQPSATSPSAQPAAPSQK